MTKQTEYAVSLLIALDKRKQEGTGKPLPIRAFATEGNISFLFLQRIAQSLHKAGFVHSIRGARGGYVLVEDLKDINLVDLTKAIEGSIAFTKCSRKNEVCTCESPCLIRKAIGPTEKKVLDILENTSIADLAGTLEGTAV